jgi:pimeloyl-ACP methyl ester carboxylesterase
MATGLLLAVAAVQASDLAKEQRWAEQIVDALIDGEAVYLDDGRSQFLAIETAATDGGIAKAAVVLHGTGVHPNWPTVVLPLRVGLTERGWHTLSIQMPVLANEAEYSEYAAIYDQVPGRIAAALDYLRGRGAEQVVLVAHSQGATMANYFLAESGAQVDGFVAVGMGPGIAGGPMDNLAHLQKVRLPLLDLYGSEDLPEVRQSAAQRATAGAANPGYRQLEVAGADHFFDGEEAELLDHVNAWLGEAID